VGEQKPAAKPFDISKQEVWDAWLKVKANKGAPGVDGQSIEDFEAGLKGNLYRIWNRMSSGSYFPPPVKAVEIPKAHGTGTRILGVPPRGRGHCLGDRAGGQPGSWCPVPDEHATVQRARWPAAQQVAGDRLGRCVACRCQLLVLAGARPDVGCLDAGRPIASASVRPRRTGP
jgi:hypothetical protein